MTDLNLKAGNLKKALATFMAVCLTVLSVNVPAFAATAENTDKTNAAGTVTVEVTSDLDGDYSPENVKAKVVVDKVTVSGEEIKNPKVNVAVDNFDVKIKNVEEVSQLNATVKVAYPENPEAAERVIEGKVVLELTDEKSVSESFKITQAAKVAEKPVDPEKPDDVVSSFDGDLDDVVDEDGNVVSAFDGNPDKTETETPDKYVEVDPDKAIDKDEYAGDLNNITIDLDGKTALKSNVVKVTVYDGLATKTSTIGSVVAVYSLKPGASVIATSKVKALETNYVDGKVFAGFVTTDKVDMNGKKITQDVSKLTTAYTFPGVASDAYVIAKYADLDVVTKLNGEITIQKGKKATVQATFPALAKGEKLTCVVVSAADGKTENDKEAKKILKSVAANAKTGTITFAAGKSTGDARAFIYKTSGKGADKKNDLLGKYEVTVVENPVVNNSLTLTTNSGVTAITLDKTSMSKTAQLTVSPSTTGVKYVVTKGTLETGSKNYATAQEAKKASAVAKADKTKAISVSKTGLVTAKKTGVANVYAVQTTKVDKNKYTVTISNPVNVTVNATATGFKLTGGKTFKYTTKDAIGSKPAVTAYNAKKTTNVKFTVKAKGETTDKIVVRAVDMNGKVVLNALNRSTKSVVKKDAAGKVVKDEKGKPVKENVFIADSYYNTVVKGYYYTEKDSLIVVATSPAGQQQYKMVKFDDTTNNKKK